jgi:predicted RNA binding protein YcfA (HicA-like mRNA interferase family)
MAKLPVMTAIEVIRGLKKAGFIFDRQAKGSHEI